MEDVEYIYDVPAGIRWKIQGFCCTPIELIPQQIILP